MGFNSAFKGLKTAATYFGVITIIRESITGWLGSK
jgi:hypothetical protein